MLISLTVRVGGGFAARAAPLDSSEKQVLFAFVLRSSEELKQLFFGSEAPFVTNLNGPKLLPV